MSRNCTQSVCGRESVRNVPLPIPVAGKRETAPQAVVCDDHHDLCCICVYDSTCIYRGDAKQPKLCCELFDVDVSAPAFRSAAACDDADAIDGKSGLCYNCENRKTCTIRSLEGDVWHCEEYC
jgi:hypothetical protein